MELSVIIAVVGCVMSIISYFAGTKKTSKDDGYELGQFMGEIRTEIKSIKDMIEELKSDSREVDAKIKEAIKSHIETYHKGGK